MRLFLSFVGKALLTLAVVIVPFAPLWFWAATRIAPNASTWYLWQKFAREDWAAALGSTLQLQVLYLLALLVVGVIVGALVAATSAIWERD